MSINFTANLVNNTKISQRLTRNNYLDIDASIVELDVNNDSDVRALTEATKSWLKNGARFIHHFCDDVLESHCYPNIKQEHFYALTTQNTEFNRLKSDKILGVMSFAETKTNENEITWLEVNPLTNKTLNKKREFKNVGTRLVEFVKNVFKSKDIRVHTAYDAEKFYKKNGFISHSKGIPDRYDMYYYKEGK